MKIYEFLNEGIDMQKYQDLLADFGMFITLNTSKISSYGIDQTSQQELTLMQSQFKKPIINGESFVDVYNNPEFYKNAKVIPILLRYIHDMLKYLEPRLVKYLNDEGKNKFLPRIDKIKQQYITVVRSVN